MKQITINSRAVLGDEAVDLITGFKGVVVALTLWYNACIRVQLQPQGLDKDGLPFTPREFDEPQLKVTKELKVKLPGTNIGKAVINKPPGGPRPMLARGQSISSR